MIGWKINPVFKLDSDIFLVEKWLHYFVPSSPHIGNLVLYSPPQCLAHKPVPPALCVHLPLRGASA